VIKLLALALAMLATPALADMSYPPAKYDIGGTTTAEVMQNYHDIFGAEAAPIIIVPVGWRALTECDRLWQERYGAEYPRAEIAAGQVLMGCMVRNPDWSNAVIVVSDDWLNPELAVRLMRHEIAHLLGWEGTHPR
jgi:hypothetical protein